MSSKISKSRYLFLSEVADLLKVQKKTQHYRVQYVRRLFRRLERRDGCVYLHSTDGSRDLRVCVDDLAQLDPYNPSTLQMMRKDVDGLERENQDLRARVARLERFATNVESWFKSGHAGAAKGQLAQ